MGNNTQMMDKVRALLAKAEGTDNEHEAEVFLAKAQQLMTEHAISEAMINSSRPRDSRLKPVQREWEVPGPYPQAKANLLMEIAKAQGCQVCWNKPKKASFYRDSRPTAIVYIVGFEDDLDATDQLYTHLLIQLTRQVAKVQPGPDDVYWHESRDWNGRSGYRQVSTRLFRSNWAEGFGDKVGHRLGEAKRNAEAAAKAAQGTGMEIALVDKAEAISDLFGELHPKLRSFRNSRASWRGYNSGQAAGARADIGNARLGGSRGALNA